MSQVISASPKGPPPLSPAPRTWDLPDVLRNRLGADVGPQRTMIEQGHVLLVLHQLPSGASKERKAALFWRTPAAEWRSTEGRGVGAGTLDAFLSTWAVRLQELEASEAAAHGSDDLRTLLEEVAPILRAARGLHRAIQQAREAVHDDRTLLEARDRAATIERTAELLLQDTQFGLDFVAAKQAERQAQLASQMAVSAHRLNVIAAMFLPITAIASLLAMEVHAGIPDNPVSYASIVFGGLVLGVGLSAWVTRRT
jgi:hypothetical protein